MHLPSGITKDHITVDIADNGTVFEVSIAWPKPIQNPEKLFAPYIKSRTYSADGTNHPEVMAMEKSLKDIRTELSKMRSDNLISTARIPLLF